MEVRHVIWCKHSSTCGQYSSAHVHRAIKAAIDKTGDAAKETIEKALPGLKIEVLKALEGDELASLPSRAK